MQIDTRNPEFQDALNLIQYTRQSVFLTGKAGTGKSTFLKYVCANVKKKHDNKKDGCRFFVFRNYITITFHKITSRSG